LLNPETIFGYDNLASRKELQKEVLQNQKQSGQALCFWFLKIIRFPDRKLEIYPAKFAPCGVSGLGNTQSIPCGRCLA
jgi:hypothetical protein